MYQFIYYHINDSGIAITLYANSKKEAEEALVRVGLYHRVRFVEKIKN